MSVAREHRRHGGFTLIEIVLALTVGAIVIAAVISMFHGNKRTFRAIESLSRMQESARFAVDFITGDLRLAGYRGCLSMAPPNAPGTIYQYTLADHPWFDFRTAARGFDGNGSSWSPALPTTLTAALAGSPQPLPDTDIITIRSSEHTGRTLSTPMSGQSAPLSVDSIGDLSAQDILILSSCTATAVSKITDVSLIGSGPQAQLSHATSGASAPNNTTTDLGAAFGTDAELLRGVIKTYYIAPSAQNPDVPALWSVTHRHPGTTPAPEQLIDGVENLQLFIGIDSDGDGSPNRFVAPNAVSASDSVVAIQFELLLRTIDDNVSDAPQGYVFAGTTVTNPGDRRIRRAFTATIGVRNRLN